MSFAVIFPGQGSQKVGMGLDLYEKSKIAKDLFAKFDKITNRNLTHIFLYGPSEELNQTKNTQVAILAISMALTLELNETFKNKKINMDVHGTAGHSLGEFTALWYSKILETDDVIKIVTTRASLMQKTQEGRMAAVLNLNTDEIQKIIYETNFSGKIVIANYNSSTQHVISGGKDDVIQFTNKIKQVGGKAIILPVSGAFHSALMQDASIIFTKELNKLNILSKEKTKIPIYQNIDGKPSSDSNLIIEKIKKQMISPVYWTQTINNLVKNGVKDVVEIGPGKVLTGLVKKINPEISCFNISDLNSLEDFIHYYERKSLSTKS